MGGVAVEGVGDGRCGVVGGVAVEGVGDGRCGVVGGVAVEGVGDGRCGVVGEWASGFALHVVCINVHFSLHCHVYFLYCASHSCTPTAPTKCAPLPPLLCYTSSR